MVKGSKLFLLSTIVLQSALLFSQSIVSEKWYGGNYNDTGYEMVQTDDGGYMITGIYGESYYNQIYLIKTDSMGEELWAKNYGGTSWDNGQAITPTLDHNYLIGGRTFSSGSTSSGKAYLLKVDSTGNFIQDAQYGSTRKDGCTSVIQASDSGYVFTGQYYYRDFWVLKTDANLNEVWSTTYGSGIGYEIMETADSNYLAIGTLYNPQSMYVAKLNSANGDTLWTCRLTESDNGFALCPSYAGGFLALGSTTSMGAGGYDIYLSEISAEGDTLSTKTFGFSGEEYAFSICQTPDSGYVIGGYTNSIGAGLNDVYVLKLNADLDTVWTETYGGAGSDWTNQIRCSKDGDYIVIASTESFGVGGDVYFLKIRENEPTSMDCPDQKLLKAPNDYHLSQNYPNPFNPSTKISYLLPKNELVEISLYNLNGQRIQTLYSGQKSAGTHELTMNAGNLASGVYFYRITAGKFQQVRKMILMR